MLKRILSMALAAVLMLGVAVMAVSAEEDPEIVDVGENVEIAGVGEGNLIYFEPPAEWGTNYKAVYCHAWEIAGDPFETWRSGKERCTKVDDNTYSYDTSSWDLGVEIAIMFHTDIGQQTYDLNFTAACIDDTAYIRNFAEDEMESPVDSTKTALIARWRNNGDSVHPVIQISSLGEVFDPDNTGLDPQQCQQTDKGLAKLDELGFEIKDGKVVKKPVEETTAAAAAADDDNGDTGATSGNSTGGGSNTGGSNNNNTKTTTKTTTKPATTNPTNPTGQENTVIYISIGIMVLAVAAIIIASRKKRED